MSIAPGRRRHPGALPPTPSARSGGARTLSASPCTTSSGTSIFATSWRKSVAHVGTHATAAIAEAALATFQLAW